MTNYTIGPIIGLVSARLPYHHSLSFVCTDLLLELFPGDSWACSAAHGQSAIIEQLSNNQGLLRPLFVGTAACASVMHVLA